MPTQRRSDARLLIVDADGGLHDAARTDLAGHLRPGDLLVANDAATIPGSLSGIHQRSGGTIEIRLAGRRSLAFEDVREFTAIAFGAGDHRTRTEDRPPPPELRPGDTLILGPLEATVLSLLGHPRLVTLRFGGTPDAIWAGIGRVRARLEAAGDATGARHRVRDCHPRGRDLIHRRSDAQREAAVRRTLLS